MSATATETQGRIRCAHCKDRHHTVAQVLLCSRRDSQPAQEQPPANVTWKPKHKSWLDVERETRPEREAQHAARQAAATPAPTTPADTPLATTQTAPPVESGRYAIYVDNTLKFFKVDRVTEGKWKGYTFVSVQASDELYPIRNRQVRERVLRIISADMRRAAQRYGQEIGRCGRCNRTLTDEVSRERGIGPDCWDKMTGA